MLLQNVRIGLAGLWFAALAFGQAGAYIQKNGYIISTPSAFPAGITEGTDGAMWFAESGCYGGNCYIGRVTTGGAMTEYLIPTPNSEPWSITKGPDGALWFTEIGAGQIGRITVTGEITEYPVLTAGSGPNGITEGPEGALWFTEAHAGLGKITTSGVVTEYPVSIANSEYLGSITTGPDGALWFTWSGYDVAGVAEMTTSGAVTSYQAPASYGPFNLAAGITIGPDHALWFADTSANIWRITTAGALTQYPVPLRPSGGGTGPITTGPDGAIWFTVTCNPCATDWIGRLTTQGVFTEFPTSRQGTLGGIAGGPGGSLWTTGSGFDLEIQSGIWRTPACGSGMNATFANNTMSVSLELGIATPAVWTLLFGETTELDTPLPPVVPPRAFALQFDQIPNQGYVAVKSELSDSGGQLLCAEWQTVNTAGPLP